MYGNATPYEEARAAAAELRKICPREGVQDIRIARDHQGFLLEVTVRSHAKTVDLIPYALHGVRIAVVADTSGSLPFTYR